MALSTAYLVTTKNLDAFLNAIKTAKAPERVNQKFLANLEFTSSNDRLHIGILKALAGRGRIPAIGRRLANWP